MKAIVCTKALYERLKAGSPAMMQTATTFGLIWAGLVIASGMVFNIGLGTVVDLYGQDPAQAATVWLAIESVSHGLGGEHEIVGGLWVLLVLCQHLVDGLQPERFSKTFQV